MRKRALAAIDETLPALADATGTRVPLQARLELLNGLSALLNNALTAPALAAQGSDAPGDATAGDTPAATADAADKPHVQQQQQQQLAPPPAAGALDASDIHMLLRWLDALVRHPVGEGDVSPVPGLLPPVQRQAMAVLAHLAGPVRCLART